MSTIETRNVTGHNAYQEDQRHASWYFESNQKQAHYTLAYGTPQKQKRNPLSVADDMLSNMLR
jgi:hypothetical protein